MKPGIKEDKWLRTVCTGCYASCAIRVHRVDGVVVKIEGDPDSVMGAQGGVCGKASSMIQQLYHPQRINYPLKRTNPNKGIGIDPKWKRISWDEALGETAERLKKIQAEDPSKLVMIFGPTSYPVRCGTVNALFGVAFGGSYGMAGMSVMCGNAAHFVP